MRGNLRSALPISIRPFMFILALLAALMWPATSVLAQGSFGTVPDPITSRELEGYADRLGLSDLQRQAVLAAHDEYREQFRVLREGDIEKFLSESQGFRGGPAMLQMNRKDIEKALKDLNNVMGKVAALDNALFDQMQAVLTEEQAVTMPRVRQSRERERYTAGLSRMVSFLNPAARADLSAMLLDIDLTLAEKQASDPIMTSYESTLTASSRRLHDGASDMVIEVLDKMEKNGFDVQSMQDPQKRGQLFEAFRTVWSEVSGKLQDKAASISTLNRRTLREVAPTLEEEHAARLRNTYLQRAYPEAFSGQNNTGRAFRIARNLDDLTPELRETITALATDYHANNDRLTDQIIEAIDDHRKNTNFMDFDNARRRTFDEKLDGLRNKRTEVNDAALASLKAALGPELGGTLDRRVAEGRGDDGGGREVRGQITLNGVAGAGGMMSVQVSGVATDVAVEPAGVDPFLPGAISPRNVAQYAAILGIDRDNDHLAVLDGLHEEYREKFAPLDDGDLKAVREASAKLWSTADNGQVQAPTPQAIDRLYALRAQALASIIAVDEMFFANIQTTMLKPEDAAKLERVRLARQRDIYNRGDSGVIPMNLRGVRGDRSPRGGGPGGGGGRGGRNFSFFGGGASQESSIDLAVMVDRLELTGDDRDKTDVVVVEYERTVAAAFRKHYEASMKRQQATDKLTAAMSQNQGGGDGQRRGSGAPGGGGGDRGGDRGPGAAGSAFRDLMDTQGRVSRETAGEIVTLNKTTLAQLIEALPPASADGLKLAYNKKAYPNVYQDSRSAGSHLTEALALDDLSPQQRSLIDNIALEFRASYEQMCDQLVKLSAAAPDFTGGGGGGTGGQQRDWQAIADQQRAAEKLTFDRDELSDKTLAKLRAVLNDEQSRRLGITREAKSQ